MLKVLLSFFLLFIYGSAAFSGTPKVVVSIKPLHSLVSQLMSGVATPGLMLDNQSPHGYVMRPSETKRIMDADLVVWVGPELETFLNKPLQSQKSSFPILSHEHIEKHPLLHPCCAHDDHHHESAIDPHIWLSPHNAKMMAKAITEKLIELDATNKSQYEANLCKTLTRLSRLSQEIGFKLQHVKIPAFVIFHDAYQYFTRHYGLASGHVMTANPDIPLSAHRINEIRKKVAKKQIKCLLKDPQFSDRFLSPLSQGHNLYIGNLDPIGYNIPAGEEAYEMILRNLAETFTQCANFRTP